MTGFDGQLREVQALGLLTNRILMDFLSLQIDSGAASVEGLKRLISFSADEVCRGSPSMEHEVRALEVALIEKFETTYPDGS